MASGFHSRAPSYLPASPETCPGSRGEGQASSAAGLSRQQRWEQVSHLPADPRTLEGSAHPRKPGFCGGWGVKLKAAGFGSSFCCSHRTVVKVTALLPARLEAKKHVSRFQLPTQTSSALSSPRRASADAGLAILLLLLQQNHAGCEGQKLSDLLVKSALPCPYPLPGGWGGGGHLFLHKTQSPLQQPLARPPALGWGAFSGIPLDL